MRKIGIYFTFIVLSVAVAQCSEAAEIINNPDASAIVLLQCKYAHTVAPYKAMAESDNAVRSADEFHRAEIAQKIEGNLKAKFAGLEGVKGILINLGSRFSEYDAQNGEYNFDISDGSFIAFSAFGRQVRIALTNGTKAQIWKLGTKEAEDVLRKNKADRTAILVLKLELLESSPAVDGEPANLNARIVSYDVLANYGHAKLGSITVEP